MKEVENEVVENQPVVDAQNVQNAGQPENEADRVLNMHTEPFELSTVYDAVNMSGILELFPEHEKDLQNISNEAAILFGNIQMSKNPYGVGLIPASTETGTYISHSEDKKKLIDILIKARNKINEIKESYPDAKSPYRKVLDAVSANIDLVMSNDYTRIQNMDPMFKKAYSSTFLTFPSNLFDTGFEDEKGKRVYSKDDERFNSMMERIPFIDQLRHRQNFMINTYLPYIKKKEAGNITPEEIANFKAAYRIFNDEQKAYFAKIKSLTVEDKDISENRTALENGVTTFLKTNWADQRFGDLVNTEIDDSYKYLEKGWTEEDITLLRQFDIIHKQLSRAVNPDDIGVVYSADKTEEARQLLAAMEQPFKKIQETTIINPEKRAELLQGITAFVDQFVAFHDSITFVSGENRIKNVHPVKNLFDVAKARNVSQADVNNYVARDEQIFGNLTTDEKVERIKIGYSNATTMVDKMNYLIENFGYLGALEEEHKLTSEEKQAYEDVKNDFINTYITNGTINDIENVYRTLGTVTYENHEKVKLRRDEILKEHPELKNEGEIGQKKAYYMARMAYAEGTRLGGIANLTSSINASLAEGAAYNALVKKVSTITANTTMEDYARMIGYSKDEDIDTYLNSLPDHPARGKKLVERYNEGRVARGRAPESVALAISNIKDNALKDLLKKWRYEGGMKYLNSQNLSDEVKADIIAVGELNSGELSKDGIKDWINTEFPGLTNEQRKRNNALNKSGFYKKYLSNYEKEKQLAAESKQRKNLPVKRNFADMLEWDEAEGEYVDNKLSPQRRDEIIRDLDINAKADADKKESGQTRLMKLDENRNIYHAAWGTTRTPTLNNIYTLWVIGTHPEISVNEFTRLEENAKLVDEFIDFCRENPLSPSKNEKQHKDTVEKWADILYKATDRFKDLEMPSIDYSDPKQVKENMFFLKKLRGLYIDFSQEKDHIFADGKGLSGKQIAKDHLGNDKYYDMCSFWSNIQSQFAPFNSGYGQILNLNACTKTDSLLSKMYTVAFSRALMKNAMKEASGRSLENFIRMSEATRNYYSSFMGDEFKDFFDDERGELAAKYSSIAKITRKDVLDYLSGINTKKFEKNVEKIANKIESEYKKNWSLNVNKNAANEFINLLEFGDVRQKLIELPDDAESMKAFLDSNEKINGITGFADGIYRKAWVSHMLNNLFIENYSELIKEAGIKREDAIKINGKSPDQLWKGKYADLPENERQKCYELEILKRIAVGNADIKLTKVAFNSNGKLEADGTYTVFKPVAEMQELNADFKIYTGGVLKIKDYLKGIQDRLLTAHENKNPQTVRNEIGVVGSDLFQNMERTLDNAIKALENEHLTINEREEKLKDYYKASSEYYKNRKSIFDKRHEEGQIRLDMSKKATDEMPVMIETYREISKSLKNDLVFSDSRVFNELQIFQYKHAFNEKYLDPKRKDNYKIEQGDLGDQLDYFIDRANENAQQKVQIDTIIRKGMKDLGKDYNKLMDIEKSSKTDPYDMAIAHLIKNVVDNVEEKGTSVLRLTGIKNDIKSRLADGSFKKEAERLAKNPVFLATIKQNKKGFHKEWQDIEKRTNSSINQIKSALDEITKDKEGNLIDVSKYIMMGGAATQNGKEALRQRYGRLGDFITKQILVDPANKVIVQAIESERMKYNEVVKTVTDCLVRKKVLDGKNFSVAEFREKLNNGDLRKMVTENVIKQTNKNASDRLQESKKMKPSKDSQGPRINL